MVEGYRKLKEEAQQREGREPEEEENHEI